jgi:protein-S-isoprenylcysteine O-methyltransferase Ste14
MKKRIRLQGFLIFLGLSISLIFSRYIFARPENAVLNDFFDFLGFIVLGAGFLFRMAARGFKKDHTGQGTILVVDGPYSVVRNPMYLGTFLIGAGIILAFFSWWVFFVFFAVFLWIYLPQTRREEETLTLRFGKVYSAYCKKTPKFFPSIKSVASRNFRDLLGLKKSWIKHELNSLLAVMGIFFIIEFWQEAGSFGAEEAFRKLFFLMILSIFYWALLLFLQRKNKT